MKHQQRVDLYKQSMAASGADMYDAVPYLWELAWSRGGELPPPHLMSVLDLAFFAVFAFPAFVLVLS